ncbi:hypothetical protein J5N97_021469 [Dioscorea zingiberensis]|uniref:DUF155 domain-containing protein n=1 Tax=Dioscorea zingiberensis TaxID=325984 RepID=A0A9D5CJY7_9LILI|nr:hypothetical protein J5N97_021469 [Dioscorea zingiberensis]
MEICRARRLLRCIVSSSFALFKNTPQRSFQSQTLVRQPPVASASFALFKETPQRPFQSLVRWPTVASSSCYLRRCPFVSQPQRRHLFRFPQAPAVMRTLSSLSSEQQQSALSENEGKQSRVFPVKAYFLCTDIDLKSLQAQYAFNVITPNSHATNFAVYMKNYPHGLEADFGIESNFRYIVVSQYGSIVMFNVPDHEADVYLKIVENHASGFLPKIKKDDYVVVERPTLEAWVQGGLDSILQKNLSIDGMGTIGSVLGQRIALDYYIKQVNQTMTELEDINCQIMNTGTFTLRTRKLLQPVSDVSSRLDFLDHKLEILKRPNIATDAQLWECLSTRFRLTEIISSLDLSLQRAMSRAWKLKFILTDKKVRLERLFDIMFLIIIFSWRKLFSYFV